jgi:ribose 5-phosphate isomerase B
MKIAIGSDNGGYELKETIKNNIYGYEFEDCGCYSPDIPVDYPDIATNVVNKFVEGECDTGILICRTGNGMVIAANKYKNIRAALCYSEESAKFSREHNDSNILALGADMWKGNEGVALNIVHSYLNSSFSKEERHERRVNKIKEIEDKVMK